jgi:hypothetical protein
MAEDIAPTPDEFEAAFAELLGSFEQDRALNNAGAAPKKGRPLPLGEPVVAPWLTNQLDAVKEGTGQRFPSGVFEPIAGAAGLAAEMTGVPSIARGATRLHDTWGEDDPYHLNKLSGAAEIAAGAMPGLAMTKAGAPLVSAMFATAPRVGATGAMLGAPAFAEAAMADTPAQARDKEIGELRKRIEAAGRKVEEIGQTKYRGKPEEAEASRAGARKPYYDTITKAEERIAKLQADADAETQEREQRGAPIRESLPPILSKTMPIWTGVLGGMATRGIFNKWNKEYNGAVQAYRNAEKTGNAVEMSMRKNQIGDLEKNTPWKNPVTYMAAGLPLELRAAEHGIDMRAGEDTRAYKDANRRIHDPYELGYDVGTGILSAGTALGLGAKFSKDQPERALGRTIAAGTAYDDAPLLAAKYENALQAGQALPVARPAAPQAAPTLWNRLFGTPPQTPPAAAAPAQSPIALQATNVPTQQALAPPERLADRVRQAQQSIPPPPPATAANQQTSNLPSWAGPPPEGVKLKKGELWDINMQRVRRSDGVWAETPKYSAPRPKKE